MVLSKINIISVKIESNDFLKTFWAKLDFIVSTCLTFFHTHTQNKDKTRLFFFSSIHPSCFSLTPTFFLSILHLLRSLFTSLSLFLVDRKVSIIPRYLLLTKTCSRKLKKNDQESQNWEKNETLFCSVLESDGFLLQFSSQGRKPFQRWYHLFFTSLFLQGF